MENRNLIESVAQSPSVQGAIRLLAEGNRLSIGGMWGASHAVIASAIAHERRRPLLLITSSQRSAEDGADDIRSFCGNEPLLLDEEETSGGENPYGYAARLGTAGLLAIRKPSAPIMVAASIRSVFEPLPSPAEIAGSSLVLKPGDRLDLQSLIARLVENRYERKGMVEMPGEFGVRGGIVDVFAFAGEEPVRIEMDGDRIGSIRHFDLQRQTSTKTLEGELVVSIVGRKERGAGGTIASYLSPEWIVAFREPDEMAVKLQSPEGGQFLKATSSCAHVMLRTLPSVAEEEGVDVPVNSLQRFSGALSDIQAEIARLRESADKIVFFCATQGEEERLAQLVGGDAFSIVRGKLSQGFVLGDSRTAYLPNHELFNRYGARRATVAVGRRGKAIEGFFDLNEGDYVVHLHHGIGKFLGIERLSHEGKSQDFAAIEYAGGSKMYLPMSNVEMVRKYVGGSGEPPALSKIGGAQWAQRKEAAKRAVEKLAGEMLHVQALRELKPGISFPADTEWETELEASFPYEETADQIETMKEIREDMRRPKPTDRLICGDVGYGKTELAVRAAFKCALFNKQTAVLVPTTILAQQHYQTFRERMADYPVTVDVLSRFRSKAEQKKVIESLGAGAVDIVIGTHRILQPDVKFKDLGLVIIDEEQRFGVEHKERLKRLRAVVDVLTLTATPIPRTLHMALLGIKEISCLTTAPLNRVSIKTEVLLFDEKKIRAAIMFELERGGQVFFVHNRVHSIDRVADRLRAIVPEASIGVAHGQMSEDDLEARMAEFLDRKIDVLVVTTIIESGLDIPSANTIFVDDADQYGLSDLHQLRGRVGRSKNQAFAYFLLPRARMILPQAQERLKAIEEFNELGAGFRIAVRDLEIRGVGNILGGEQHGHIAAVGYDLYCRMLNRTVKKVRKERIDDEIETTVDIDVDAYLPPEYIGDKRTLLTMYRSICACKDTSAIGNIRRELADRFGALPPPAETLLQLMEVKILAGGESIVSIVRGKESLILSCLDASAAAALKKRFPAVMRLVEENILHIPLKSGSDDLRALQTIFGENSSVALTGGEKFV